MNRSAKRLSLACALCCCLAALAYAGPPFLTDDPVPTVYGHFETYMFSAGNRPHDGASGDLAGIEINYGVVASGQLIIGSSVAFDDADAADATQIGVGDTKIGFKYSFLQESETRPQIAFYPEIDLPTASRQHQLGTGHLSAFLPVWAQNGFGDGTVSRGGGYWLNADETSGDEDYWSFGFLLQRKLTETLTIGGEIFYQKADNEIGVPETGFGVGGSFDIDAQNHILASVGRDFGNNPDADRLAWYVGWQITN